LYQFKNGSEYRPLPGDILIFDSNYKNRFGHAGIVTYSKGNECEIIQQNVGSKTREIFGIMEVDNKFFVLDKDVLGWMRKG
jgi:signal peptidase I